MADLYDFPKVETRIRGAHSGLAPGGLEEPERAMPEEGREALAFGKMKRSSQRRCGRVKWTRKKRMPYAMRFECVLMRLTESFYPGAPRDAPPRAAGTRFLFSIRCIDSRVNHSGPRKTVPRGRKRAALPLPPE